METVKLLQIILQLLHIQQPKLEITNPAQTCIASVFGWEDDKHRGGEAICLHRDLRPDDLGIASRDLKCGTKVVLLNPRTGRKVTARVVDHGPYGARYKGRWVIKRKETDPGIWRGCIDITQRTQKALRHNGFEELEYYVQR